MEAAVADRMMFRSAGFSLAMHLLAFGLPYYLLVVRVPDMVTVELDLSPMPAQFQPGPTRRMSAPSEAWSPVRNPTDARAMKPEPAAENACPPPCPDTPGDFVPAGLAGTGPRWIQGFITDDDYPPDARRLGLEGQVLLAVFIRDDGSVREVRLVKGAYPALNEVAIEKVRASRFVPARDVAGNPVPCKLILPIKFELH